MPAPASTVDEASRRRKEGGRSQKLMLFMRGNAMSEPPIMMGITIKKIMTKAWAVTITL